MTSLPQREKKQKRPSFSDGLLHGRNALLDRLAGAAQQQVLNPIALEDAAPPPADLAAAIKQTLADLKAAVMEQDGAKVDYAALRASPAYSAYQEKYLAKLHRFQPQLLPTTEARRAFWINLYNALVLDAVISFDIHDSVTEGRLGIFSFFRRAAYRVDGQRLSLEDIEHGILRGNRGNPYVPGPHFAAADPRCAYVLPLDPRIHFALNCGGISCPPIRSYAADKLDVQLDLAARHFINGSVQTFPDAGEVTLSQILRWYEGDFGSGEALIDFLIAHLPDDARRTYLADERGAYRFNYTPYDWHLNGV